MAAEIVRARVGALVAGLGGRSFVEALATLQAGSLGLTAISFVASVALARILEPAGYGTYTLVMSAGTTIGLARRLGQDYAATTRLAEGYGARDQRSIRDALVFYVFLSVLTSVVVLPPAMLFAPWLGEHFFGGTEIGPLLQLYLVQGFWAVVPGLTVIALQSSRRMATLVGLENTQSLAMSLLPVGLVLLGSGVAGVFVGQVIASLLGLVIGAYLYLRVRRDDPIFPSVADLTRGVVRPGVPLWPWTRYGLSIALDKNLVSLYTLAPILLLGWFVPEEQVGELRVALSYMAIPAVLLTPISRLLMVDLPRLRVTSPERVRPVFLRVTLLGVAVSTLLAVPFAAVAWFAIPLLYGGAYHAAAPLTLVILLDAATLGLGIAAGPIFRTYDRTDLPIRTSLAILGLGLPAAYLLAQSLGPLGAAAAYAGMLVASRLVSYIQCLYVTRSVLV
ncbi:MAG: oligosaccharide flippase family protein [Chloroflexi bacterium]|nr:oligosaccharide flippase family protein [Chloroflexota bacterium]